MMARENWTREQTIIAFNLYCKIIFGKAHSRNPEVIEVANLIGRSPGAVARKLGNFGSLDPELRKRGVGGLPNRSKLDEEIWNEFREYGEERVYESERLIAKIKGVPIEKLTKINLDDLPREGKEREAIIKVRVNQHFFRKAVLISFETKCCITGIAIPELLVASHIIPWGKEKEYRMNLQNGLCLNQLHDKAFDRGLITVNTDFQIVLSNEILKREKEESIQKYFLPYNNMKIKLPNRFIPELEFLEYHHKNIFKK